MLLNQNLVALLSNTRELQSIFLKVQAQLIELAGPQVSNTLSPQTRIAIDEPCHRYQQGRCRYPAEVCNRLHVDASPKFGSTHTPFGGHRPTNVSPKPGTLTFATRCRDISRGECLRGTGCRFAHDKTPGPWL
jgi:hypothetical protein